LVGMAENLNKAPKRGILKQSTSFEHRGEEKSMTKEPHFDETNILATLHPVDKDYGFMKIEEPKTPFEPAYSSDEEDGAGARSDVLDAGLLAAKIAAEGNKGPRPRRISEPSGDAEDLNLLSPEEREKRRSFESKRKQHYNEFQAVKMARALMAKDDEDDEEEENKDGDLGEDNGESFSEEEDSSSPMDTEPVQ